jgi:hypothetical protein
MRAWCRVFAALKKADEELAALAMLTGDETADVEAGICDALSEAQDRLGKLQLIIDPSPARWEAMVVSLRTSAAVQ